MVLIDDPKKQVIEPIAEHLENYKNLYDFDLMMDGGHITGYHIHDEASIFRIIDELAALADTAVFKHKYNLDSSFHSE